MKGFIKRSHPYIGEKSNRRIMIGSKAFRKIFTDRGFDASDIDILQNELRLEQGDIRGAYGLISERQRFSEKDILNFRSIVGPQLAQKKVMKFILDDGTEEYFTLRGDNFDEFTEALRYNYFDADNVIQHGSDKIEEMLQTGISSMKLVDSVEEKKSQQQEAEAQLNKDLQSFGQQATVTSEQVKELLNKTGGFFRYLNKSGIDLTRYQIISSEEEKHILNEHCIIYALEKCGIEKDILDNIKTSFNPSSHFPKKNLHQLSDIIRRKIVLSFYEKRGRMGKQTFGKKYEKSINLAINSDHYFINDNIIYREKNYKSLQLIKLFFKEGFFVKDDFIITYTPQYQKCNRKDIPLTNIEDEQELYEYKPKNGSKLENAIFFADTEAQTTVGKKHEGLMIGVVKMKKINTISSTRVYVRNEKTNFVFDFLSYIVQNSKNKKPVVYFHNLKYDYHILLPYLWQSNAPVMKDNQLYSVTVLFRKKLIEFRDSYKLAPIALSKFNKTFQLKDELNKKEAIAYNYYKIDNLKIESVDINEYETYLPVNQRNTFRNNLRENERLFQVNSGKFNPIEYYKYYLRYDCLVLCEGLKKYAENINAITGNKLDFFNYLTISSLTNDYMGLMGSFDGLYKVAGNLREFISKAVTGGRVQCLERTKKKVINKKIADYDGVSLYPSAIHRLCNDTGLPKGMAKRIQSKDKKVLDKYSYYIVQIRINKINNYQQLPFVSYKDDKGILRYTNDAGDGLDAVVDNITLNDWIKFQDIEFEIIDGVYWNEGYNKQMGKVIEKLFTNRLKEKKKGNQAMQQVLKLMMNSSYGKTIIKKSMSDKKILSKDKINSFVKNYYYIIKKPIEKLNDDQYLATVDSIDTSFNLAHVGVSILSTSKRIMNEVFDIANTNSYPIYYTDTDSMHCNYEDVAKIEKQFKLKYNRELTGKQLGQFHIDFDLEGAKEEIYATQSIFLGKKCYIDRLESRDSNGKTITGYHYRMKGVTVAGLEHQAKEYQNGMFGLYEDLINNKVNITLNPEGKFMCKYSNNKILTWETGKFVRELKF